MNCKKYENLMMQHFDGKIQPRDACELAKHVLVCETCRELYLTFDESAECAQEITPAPENFTKHVMAAVREEKKYSAAKEKNENSFAPRLLAAFNVVLLGLGFMFALNPDIIYFLPPPVLENLLSALSSVGAAMNAAAEWTAQTVHSVSAEGIGVIALIFAAITGVLLFVLQNGEKIKT